MTTPFDSISREALAAAAESSRVAWMGLGREWPGWVRHDDPDLLWRIAPSLPHPPFNTATRARFSPETVAARLDAILGVYRQNGLPLVWWVNPSSEPADLRERLDAYGLVNEGAVPGMAADLTSLPQPASPAGLAISAVEDEAALIA
jgi:hypothetical protein